MNAEVKGAACELIDSTGNVIGFANCTIWFAEKADDAISFGRQKPELVAKRRNSMKVFSSDGADISEMCNRVKQIRAVEQIDEHELYEHHFKDVQQDASGTSTFNFDSDSNLYIKSPITVERFREVGQGRLPIDWSKIKAGGCTGGSKGNAFEELCRELLRQKDHRGYYCNFSFFPPGPDRGRDGSYELCEEPFPTVKSMVTCILQCKYSESVKTDIQQREIYDELVKVKQHNPRHFVLVTNRNIKPNFEDWFKAVDFPFTKTLVPRDVLESLIKSNPEIWSKYFGR